ncbi:TetR/AcrR family transcriptional regulator [Nocardioides sp. GXZ039]|uniref:TetR/AcrR family transcriptional regulator n=1 Tax=Nocardioides sp. GXZ039 TaxID=3136018 RepID=UPI0030F3CE68
MLRDVEEDADAARPGNRRGRRSRREILEVASRLMAERGYAATSLSVLSAETGLPKSAIYHHFRSKAGLLTAVMEEGLHDFFAAMRAAQAQPPEGGSPRERMTWFLERTSEVFMARQEFLRLHMILILSAEAHEAEVADTITKVRTEGRVLMNHMIRSAFQDEDPAIAAAVADELEYLGIAGFDGGFIAMQADPERDLLEANRRLAEAMVSLGEATAARLRSQ